MKILSTINFNIIQELCSESLEKSKMIALIGEPGFGKTVGLRYFISKNTKNCIYLVVRKSMKTKDFYLELLSAIGYNGEAKNLSLYVILNLIITKINSHRNKLILIIDEAGKFTPGQLEYIHELRDRTENNMGIILSGPQYFYDNLYEWVDKKVVGIPEVFRRIQSISSLYPPSFNEIKAFCFEYEINDLKFIRAKFKDSSNFAELINRIHDYLEI